MTQHPTPDGHPAHRPLKQRLARLWVYFRQYRIGWVMAAVGTLISGLSEASIPGLLKPLLDDGFTDRTLPVWAPGLAIIALFILRGLAHFASQYALSRIANDGIVLLRRQLFGRLLDAELSLFAQQSASKLANTIVYEVQTGSTTLVQTLLSATRDAVTVIGLLGYLLYLNWQLTLIVLVLAPAVAFIIKTMSRRLYHFSRQRQDATDALAYVVEENVLAHRIVRLHGAQTQQAARFEQLSQHLRSLALKATRAAAATMPLTQLVSAIALSVVIGIALSQSQSSGQSITVGGFVAFIGAMLMLIAPMRRLSDVIDPRHPQSGCAGARAGFAGLHPARIPGHIARSSPPRPGRHHPHPCAPDLPPGRYPLAGRCQPARASRANRGLGGPLRFRQDHPGQSAAAFRATRLGPSPARWA